MFSNSTPSITYVIEDIERILWILLWIYLVLTMDSCAEWTNDLGILSPALWASVMGGTVFVGWIVVFATAWLSLATTWNPSQVLIG